MVAAVGGVHVATWLRVRSAGWSQRERLARAGRVGVLAWLVLSTWALVVFVSIPVSAVSSYSADDAAAMAWLRANAAPGSVVANDGFADAGIWIPYKAGLPIILRRTATAEEAAMAQPVIDNIAQLDSVPAATAAACALNVGYVYYGAKNTAWQKRTFPPPEQMKASPALRTLFTRGGAVVFGVRLNCAVR
jgi:hypothetical protein